MTFSTLSEWLALIQSLPITEVTLGLDRVKTVAERLGVLKPRCKVIIVGGTNGKGSTVATLEAIYQAAAYQVGTFTTPFLLKYNEQVKLNGQMVADAAFCEAFAKIEKARGDILLTPFEFSTLAALIIFQKTPLDILILEVGLGGRLDAVNIIDADVSIITSIGIDHTYWLGTTREAIAIEKAGILRQNKPAVCGDEEPPLTLVAAAQEKGAIFFCQGKDFNYEEETETWSWFSTYPASPIRYGDLPKNALLLQNLSTALMAMHLLSDVLPVSESALRKGLSSVTLAGRLQVLPGKVTEIHDVAHNPAAVTLLKSALKKRHDVGKRLAVFSMLADKDILACINIMADVIDEWFIAPLQTKRAANQESLKTHFKKAHVTQAHFYTSIPQAYAAAYAQAQAGDCIIVFGSFHTLAEALV